MCKGWRKHLCDLHLLYRYSICSHITQTHLHHLETPKTFLLFSLYRDKDELFVPSAIHFEIIYLRPDKPATVPCRVTNPKIKVAAQGYTNGNQCAKKTWLLHFYYNKAIVNFRYKITLIKQHERYSQLILTSPSAADTGDYSCWVVLCDGEECAKDGESTSATYIYFTDKDELFVPSAIHFEIIYLRPDKPATVPFPAEEITVDGTQISYNPTKGFIIQNPSPEHKGAYYCKANSTTKTTPQISTKYQLLYVEVPSGPPFATIEASSNTVSGGDIFNVTCTVLGEPEMNVSFSWRYPGQGQRPVNIQDSWRLINRGVGHTTRISQSVMIVDDVETIDYEKYICSTKNKHGETLVATTLKSHE
uniref:Platelet-derived growth factor receptor-like protein n=1 Tax=Sinocyclocheilus anshuiensis TaxID=1608454 RepID=A0A671NR57_9TELE